MTDLEKENILNRANSFLNNLSYEKEMTAIPSSLLEHDFCYSVNWCQKEQLHLKPKERTFYIGAGRVLISKLNDMVEYAGSAPIDWIHEFELRIQNLEEYWELEINFSKPKISSLKTLLKVNTPDLIKMVTPNSKILIEDDHFFLETLKSYLDQAKIQSQLLLKVRNIKK